MKRALFSILFMWTAAAGEVVLAFGDSVTACTRPPLGACPFAEEETYREKIAAALSATVINGGVSGATTEESLGRLKPLLETHRPRKVIIMFGLNDSLEAPKGVSVERYKENLSTFVKQCRKRRAIPILLTPNVTRDTERNQIVALYAQAVREVAIENRVLLVDVYQKFCEVHAHGLMEDRTYDVIHPNEFGQTVISNSILEALKKRR